MDIETHNATTFNGQACIIISKNSQKRGDRGLPFASSEMKCSVISFNFVVSTVNISSRCLISWSRSLGTSAMDPVISCQHNSTTAMKQIVLGSEIEYKGVTISHRHVTAVSLA